MNGHYADKIAELNRKCQEVKNNAYCPYSKFRVGAAVLTDKGNIYTGCNVENCSYGLTVCAEVTAVSNAVSAGDRNIVAISVSTDLPPTSVKSMCGRCRQFIAEFSTPDAEVIMVSNDGSTASQKMSELLPNAFTPKSLAANAAINGHATVMTNGCH